LERDIESLLNTALTAARKAGEYQKERFLRPTEVFFKGAIDLVTDVDRESETIILDILREATPDDVDILSEETPFNATNAPLLWIVDPLDGTTNYAHGYPCFSVSIALQEGRDLTLGVVYNSVTGDCYTAVKGKGAFKNGRPLKVSNTARVEHALLCTGFPYDVGTSRRNNIREFSTVIRRAQGIRRDGSAALDLCRVAEGAFDGFWELKLKPWDVAAGVLIAREAGGTVTTLEGAPFDLFADTILCTNGLIHEALQILLHEPA